MSDSGGSVTTVVNKYHSEFDVDICRPGIWGNPFVIGRDGDRDQVVEQYAKWIVTQDELLNQLLLLEGKRLGCVCKPKRCHGDVLVDIISRRSAAQGWLL